MQRGAPNLNNLKMKREGHLDCYSNESNEVIAVERFLTGPVYVGQEVFYSGGTHLGLMEITAINPQREKIFTLNGSTEASFGDFYHHAIGTGRSFQPCQQPTSYSGSWGPGC